MKKTVLIVLSLGALMLANNPHAAAFTAGNIVVLRIGDPSSTLQSGGNLTYLDEYQTDGTFVQTTLCPTNWTISGNVTNWPICNRATSCSGSEGMLHRSVDGQYLFLAGYGTNGAALPLGVDIASIRGTNWVVVGDVTNITVGLPRIIARCDWNGNFDTTTALTNTYSGAGNYPRGAISTEGRTLWLAGQGVAARTCDLGDTYATSLNGATSGGQPNPVNNVRDVGIYDYHLYASIGGTSALFSKVGLPSLIGLPTGGDKVWTNLVGVSTNTANSPVQFLLLNVTNSVPGVNVLYFADNDATGGNGGIYKYYLSSGIWSNVGRLFDVGNNIDTAANRINGLTGETDGSGNVTLYFTVNTGCLGSYLYKAVDASGIDSATNVVAITQLASLGTPLNQVWMGVAYAPSSNAAPPSAGFAASPTTGPAPLFVTFYFTNTVGAITNVFWDFGDASNPNYMGDPTQTNRMVHNVTHYYAPGTYTVTNIVSGPLGSSTRVAVNYIVVTNPPLPKADFTLWQSNSAAPSTVIFTNVSYGGYTNQFWDFGDGATTNLTPVPPPAISNSSYSVRHDYPYSGTYTVTLTVRSYSGISTTQKVVTVGGAVSGIGTAAFNVNTDAGTAPLTVAFFDNSTGCIVAGTRNWDFGDGDTTNIQYYTSGSFPHTYTTGGTYSVTLSLFDCASSPPSVMTTNITVTSAGSPFSTWQSQYWSGGSGNPNAAPNADPDGDGLSNTNEFLTGFNPTNSAAYLHVISVAKSGSDMKVTYLGANGDGVVAPGPKTNVLEFAIGTANGSYSNNFVSTGQTNELTGGTGVGTITNMVDSGGATNNPSRYYRVRVLVP